VSLLQRLAGLNRKTAAALRAHIDATGELRSREALRAVPAAWSKWPSSLGHSWPPRARQTAYDGLGLLSSLRRSGPSPQIRSISPRLTIQVPGIGPKTYANVAGFLRITRADGAPLVKLPSISGHCTG